MSDPRLRPEQVNAMRFMLVSAAERSAKPDRAPRIVRRVGFGALAAGALAAVVAAVTVVVPAGRPADPSAGASTMLREAAKATDDPEVGDGQFLRLATSASYLALTTVDGRVETTIGYLESQLREVYLPADETGRPVAQTTYVEPTVFFGDGAQEFAAREWSGQSDVVAVPVSQQADATRPVEDQSAMPRDPAALLAYLTEFRYQAGSSDENVFAHVVDLLRAGNVKSDLRAALYEALALMPSVVITEQQASLDGRVGTAIGLQGTEGDTRQEIIIDPTTGEYIGVRLVTISGFGEIPPGTPLEYTALSTSVVNQVPR
ncbi:hypothetical protein GCM10027413_07760 [Conyzicola nivalis]|uniref:Uncharacterized protein n=1 Tax=Conyzicola nivalis TaxID=1477021 RepID=A0A916SM84_9MICO|nr:CU044_5270 family protein [Conyzicola nivalis]GGB04416.1 hypothetical protein GCM10010979_18870 [Conyzicola nivalis]